MADCHICWKRWERREGWWRWLCDLIKVLRGDLDLDQIILNGFRLRSDQIILCTPSFPLFMWISAVAEEEEELGGGVGYTRRRRRISTQARASTRVSSPANSFICSLLPRVGFGRSGLEQDWIGKCPPGLRLVAGLGGHLSYHLGPTSNIGSAEIHSMQWVKKKTMKCEAFSVELWKCPSSC